METGARPRGTDGARVIQVIETKSLRGSGLNEKDKNKKEKTRKEPNLRPG